MNDKKKNDTSGMRQEIDIRLDGLLGELGKTLGDVLGKLEQGVSEVQQTRNFQTPRGPVRAEAGIRIRTLGGRSSPEPSQSFEQPLQSEPEPAPAARDINASMFEEGGQWTLSAELPGISEDQVALSVDAGRLEIVANGKTRVYSGQFDIPTDITREDITISLRHGILDLVAARSGGGAT